MNMIFAHDSLYNPNFERIARLSHQFPEGKLMLTVLGGVAQFEREMMLERQREGVAKGKVNRPGFRGGYFI